MPDRCVFLTDCRERDAAQEAPPPPSSEVLCNFAAEADMLTRLRRHLVEHDIMIEGITCFDCESLLPAARAARILKIDYLAEDAVHACRSKYDSKRKWRNAGLPCPRAALVGDAQETISFLRAANGPVVMKPTFGSGSEYIFRCDDEAACTSAFATIAEALEKLRRDPEKPLYSRDGLGANARHACVAEEHVEGDEYSCDFVIDDDCIKILRIAKKISLREEGPFGTALAYIVPAELPPGLDLESFRRQLHSAARTLGLRRSICMLDFIVRGGIAVMLELTPRPGGDCLPPLLLCSSGFDILHFTVDFAAGRESSAPPPCDWRRLVGLRLLAHRAGTVTRLDAGALRRDRRVIDVRIKRSPGERISLPPDDYASRILGHVIFAPSSTDRIGAECSEIVNLLDLEVSAA